MNYTVIWQPFATNGLAEVWNQADDRDAVTRAAHALELRLQRDPVGASEGRRFGSRVAFQAPLAVLFEVIEDDKKVVIGAAWAFRVGRR